VPCFPDNFFEKSGGLFLGPLLIYLLSKLTQPITGSKKLSEERVVLFTIPVDGIVGRSRYRGGKKIS